MLVSQVPASLAPKTFRARQTRHQRAIVSTSASGSQYPASFEKADATPCSGELRGQSGEAPPTHGLPLGRRSAMATIASLGATAWLPAPPAFADDGAAAVQLSGVDVDLEKRLTTTEGVGWPGPFNGPYVGQIFYPNWLFGEWSAESALTDVQFPKGPRLAPREAAAAAKLDRARVVAYPVRFFSTLPDTAANALRVNLGAVPQQKVIADKAFNRASYTNAVLGAEAVERVELGDAGRETVFFARGAAKAEIYQNSVRQSDLGKSADTGLFRTGECFRQVRVGVEQVDVRDYELLCRFTRESPDRVRLRQRVAVYLTPQDAEYFSAPGQPVAVYDYDVMLTRRRGPPPAEGGGDAAGAQGAAAAGAEGAEGLVCVLTPKGVVQCVDG